jgi:hypothetical protein
MYTKNALKIHSLFEREALSLGEWIETQQAKKQTHIYNANIFKNFEQLQFCKF